MAIGYVNSEPGKLESGDGQSNRSKPSEIAMYIEIGVAVAAIISLLTMTAWVLYSGSDWISSIHRFQEMI